MYLRKDPREEKEGLGKAKIFETLELEAICEKATLHPNKVFYL